MRKEQKELEDFLVKGKKDNLNNLNRGKSDKKIMSKLTGQKSMPSEPTNDVLRQMRSTKSSGQLFNPKMRKILSVQTGKQ